MSELQAFRQETRDWLDQNCPESMRHSPPGGDEMCWGGRNYKFVSEDQKQWMERMAAKGWTAPDWPTEYGGGGLDKAEHKILKEELAKINARSPLDSFGIWMIGPALLEFGSETLSSNICHRLSEVKFVGVRATRNLDLVQIWPVFKLRVKIGAIILSPMVKKFGRPMPTKLTGCSACCEPTLKPKSKWASVWSSSICRRLV